MSFDRPSAQEFILNSEIGPQSVDADLYKTRFMEEMRKGLGKESSSLAMIPTYVSCREQIRRGEKAIAVDFGGTNFRTALLRFEEDGVHIEHFNTCPSPGKERELTWDEFIGFVADCIRPLTEYTDKIGICISFPTTITPDRDGIIHYFTKEIKISGCEGRRVCADLKEALGMPDAEIKAINDTTAVLLSALSEDVEPEGVLGVIVGTGLNVCCQIEKAEMGLPGNGKMIVDVESGGFVSPDCSETDAKLDRGTAAPGVYLEEKKVAGAYLGLISSYALQLAAGRNIFSPDTSTRFSELREFDTPTMDRFGAGEIAVDGFSTETDAAAAREIVRAVFARAAKRFALSIAAVLEYGSAPGSKVTVSADGSVILKSSLFRLFFFKYMDEYCGAWDVNYVAVKDATLIGTAIGAIV